MRLLFFIVISVVLSYLCLSYTVWDINPGNWEEADRLMSICLFAIFLVVFNVVNDHLYLSLKQKK